MSMFVPFPKGCAPLKLLVYGDPGTEKTRRALSMPGPIYVIDLECGAVNYSDLVEEKDAFYLRTKSHSELFLALEELELKPPGSVGTLVIDPISQVWKSLQNGHVQRQVLRKRKIAEDVFFDVGTWGKLKRSYGDIMSYLLSAPYHVVMTARGKDKIDERGAVIEYAYEGERSTSFLANVVIESRRGYDIVIKDRTGTHTEQAKIPRVAFTDFLPKESPTVHLVDSDTGAALKDAQLMEKQVQLDPHWAYGGGKKTFLLRLEQVGITYEQVCLFCQQNKRPIPEKMGHTQRDRLLIFLDDSEQRKKIFSESEEGEA
jgi:hypothetical protein